MAMQEVAQDASSPVERAGEERKPPAAVGAVAGKRPTVLSPAEVRRLLCSIDTTTATGLHDLAMLAVMIYCFVRPGAVPDLRVGDYERVGQRRWLRLHAETGRPNRVPVDHRAAAYLDAYLTVAGIGEDGEGRLFRRIAGSGAAGKRPATSKHVMRTVRELARAAGVSTEINIHMLRATGLAMFLAEGGTSEQVMAMTGIHNPSRLERYAGHGPVADGKAFCAGMQEPHSTRGLLEESALRV